MQNIILVTFACLFSCLSIMSFSCAQLGKGGTAYLQDTQFALAGKNLMETDFFPIVGVISESGEEVKTEGRSDKGRVYIVVPKLGTSVCDTQVKALNVFVRQYKGPTVEFFVVSRNSTVEQVDFKKENNISKDVQFLSDTKGDFGLETGTALEGTNILARTVFFVDNDSRVGKIVRFQDLLKAPEIQEEMALLLGDEECDCGQK